MLKTYRKIYTRDNGLIIQSAWTSAFLDGFEKNAKNPICPPNIYYVNDGAVEIWDCKESFDWFMGELLEKNIKDPGFFQQNTTDYRKTLKELKKYKTISVLSSVSQLKEFIKLVFIGSRQFVIFYYSAYDERTPSQIRQKALDIRNRDSFYDDCERIIKNSLSKIYPEVKGMELVITLDDLNKIPSISELHRRMKNSVFVYSKFFKVIKLEDFLRKSKEYRFVFNKLDPETLKQGVIRGQIAYGGFAKGIVRILRRKIQVSELKKDEILVSPMTTPDFLPAMEKAAAIITDEGGITCHAAIVAREIKKPCIIGTKIATQVLKDGDLVEVDADKGIVKILKRK
jgi:phosphohistidine swiveling domain-containing protein